jgi:predicted DNA binding protein
MRQLTERFPDARIEVLDRLPLPRRKLLTEIRLHGSDWLKWGRSIRRMAGVVSVQFLGESSAAGTYRITAAVPVYLGLFQKLRIVERYPFWVGNGGANWVVTGSKPQIREFCRELAHLVPRAEATEIRPGLPELVHESLTERQQEFLGSAFNRGYYEVPRRVSLTHLAVELQISKGALSKVLAVAEGKLIAAGRHALLKNDR